MSSLEVRIKELTVEPHPNADRLDVVRVDGYQCVAQKDRYKTGDKAIYVPEDAIVPDHILKVAGFWDEEKDKGMLGGTKGNRVRPVRLRGVLSQGILLDLNKIDLPATNTNDDIAALLGINKWEAPIPAHLAGDVAHCPSIRSYTDIENIKKYPTALDGYNVVATEKLHGSCCIFHFSEEGEFFVSSKGMASKGLVLVDKPDSKGNFRNAYWRAAQMYDVVEKFKRLNLYDHPSYYFVGELLGVQDLKYGCAVNNIDFRLFDVASYRYGDLHWASWDTVKSWADLLELPLVPEVYNGLFDYDTIREVSHGTSLIDGVEHIREGVVVRPHFPAGKPHPWHDECGRLILKSISDDYLVRKGGTEYN